MSFAAVCLSNGEYDQKGFETQAEAEKYIEGLICNLCLSDLRKGHVIYEHDGEEVKEEIKGVLSTSCGAEWLVIPDYDYEKAGGVTDLFIAAGMVPTNEAAKARLTPEQLERIKQKQEEREKEEKKQS